MVGEARLPNTYSPELVEASEADKEKSKAEYIVMLNAFRRLLLVAEDEEDMWDGIEFLAELRADALIDRVHRGLNLSADEVRTRLIKATPFLTDREKEERDILIAAYDNLVEFAVAQQYAMVCDLPEPDKDYLSEADIEEYEETFSKYNSVYASQENQDVFHAAGIAFWWLGVESSKIITYMTQRDERVRDTHAILDGFYAPKHSFPPELIPPIEFGCRCYLTSDSNYIMALSKPSFSRKPEVNPVFSESLATKGRIFTDHHSYFKMPKKAKDRVKEISERIKKKYYGN